MHRILAIAVAALALLSVGDVQARGSRGGYRSTSPRLSIPKAPRAPSYRPPPAYKAPRPPKSSTSTKCSFCPRDSAGRIERSSKAKSSFQKSNPCPSTGRKSGGCPGYVVDHVTPLKRGGADAPSNMQWQSEEAAKMKDRTE